MATLETHDVRSVDDLREFCALASLEDCGISMLSAWRINSKLQMESLALQTVDDDHNAACVPSIAPLTAEPEQAAKATCSSRMPIEVLERRFDTGRVLTRAESERLAASPRYKSHRRHEWDQREGWFDECHTLRVSREPSQRWWSEFLPIGYGRMLAEFVAEHELEMSAKMGDVLKLYGPQQGMLPKGWLYARKLHSPESGLVPKGWVEAKYIDLRAHAWRSPASFQSLIDVWLSEQAALQRNERQAALRGAMLAKRLKLKAQLSRVHTAPSTGEAAAGKPEQLDQEQSDEHCEAEHGAGANSL